MSYYTNQYVIVNKTTRNPPKLVSVTLNKRDESRSDHAGASHVAIADERHRLKKP